MRRHEEREMFNKNQHLLVYSCSVAKATNSSNPVSLSFRPISKIQLGLHAVYVHSALHIKINNRFRTQRLNNIIALSTRLLVK